jgi:hypothetical protein
MSPEGENGRILAEGGLILESWQHLVGFAVRQVRFGPREATSLEYKLDSCSFSRRWLLFTLLAFPFFFLGLLLCLLRLISLRFLLCAYTNGYIQQRKTLVVVYSFTFDLNIS